MINYDILSRMVQGRPLNPGSPLFTPVSSCEGWLNGKYTGSLLAPKRAPKSPKVPYVNITTSASDKMAKSTPVEK